MSGKFIFKINQEGMGPGEYLSVNDFSISDENIFVHDSQFKKLVIYSSKDGEYVDELRMDIYAGYFEVVNDRILFFSDYSPNPDYTLNDQYPNLLITNHDMDLQESWLYFSEINPEAFIRPARNLQKINSSVLIYQPFDYNFYNYSEDGLEIKYHLNFGKNIEIENSDYFNKLSNKNIPTSQLINYLKKSEFSEINYYLDSKNILYFVYKYNNIYNHVYF